VIPLLLALACGGEQAAVELARSEATEEAIAARIAQSERAALDAPGAAAEEPPRPERAALMAISPYPRLRLGELSPEEAALVALLRGAHPELPEEPPTSAYIGFGEASSWTPRWRIIERGTFREGVWKVWWAASPEQWFGWDVDLSAGEVTLLFSGPERERPDWIAGSDHADITPLEEPHQLQALAEDPRWYRRELAAIQQASPTALALDPHPRVREMAVLMMSDRGVDSPPITAPQRDAIITGLFDRDDQVRASAHFTAGASGDPALAVAILPALCDPEPAVRRQAIGMLGGALSRAQLAPLLLDPDARTAHSAAEAWDDEGPAEPADVAAAVQAIPMCTPSAPPAYGITLWSPALADGAVSVRLLDAEGVEVGRSEAPPSPTWVATARIPVTGTPDRAVLGDGEREETIDGLPIAYGAAVAGLCERESAPPNAAPPLPTFPSPGSPPPPPEVLGEWQPVRHWQQAIAAAQARQPGCPAAADVALDSLDYGQLRGWIRGLVNNLSPDEQVALFTPLVTHPTRGQEVFEVWADRGNRSRRRCDMWVEVMLAAALSDIPESVENSLRRCAYQSASVLWPLADADSPLIRHYYSLLPETPAVTARLEAELTSEDLEARGRAFEAVARQKTTRGRGAMLPLSPGAAPYVAALEVSGCAGDGDGGHRFIDDVLVLEPWTPPSKGVPRVVLLDAGQAAGLTRAVCGALTVWERAD